MAQNKSKHYIYFKGPNKTDGKTDHIKNLKKFLKFFKVFIYLFLLVITLIGCIQGMFFIKTSSYSGTGAELYMNGKNVTVHVTSIVKSDDKYPIFTKNAKDNYWLKDEELAEVTAQIKKGGGVVNKWDTYNETLRLVNEDLKPLNKDGKTDNKFHGIFNQGKYIASAKTLKKYDIVAGDQTIKYYTKEKDGKVKVWEYKMNKKDFEKDVVNIKDEDKEFREWKRGFIFDATAYLMEVLKKSPVIKDITKWSSNMEKWDKSIISIAKLTGINFSEKDKTTYVASISLKNKNVLIGDNKPLKPIITWADAWEKGPFYGMFVWPLSRLTIALISAFPMMAGWETLLAIAITVILIRSLAYSFTFKSVLQQVKQQEMGAKKAAIEAKYEAHKGNKQMDRRKQQEVADLYKKEGISPLGALGAIFITMPIFISMWRVIQGIPHIKSTTWITISFSATSYKELFIGSFQYLPLMIVTSALNGFSQFLPRLLSKSRDKNRINAHQKAAMKKSNKTQNIIMIVFMFMPLMFSAGVQIYWIFGSIFVVFQNLVSHKVIQMQSRKRKRARGRG